jgi:hypothetical protein
MRIGIVALGVITCAMAGRVGAVPVYNPQCSEGCPTFDEGYEWARANGIASEFECDGRSLTFIEGCRAYVDDNLPEGWVSVDPEDDGNEPDNARQ